MELQYELTIDDSMACQKHSARTFSAVSRSWPVRLVTGAVFLAGYVVFRLTRPEGTPVSDATRDYVLVIFLAAALSTATSMVRRIGASRFIRNVYAGAPQSIPITLVLRPDGVVCQAGSGTELTPWQDIRRVEEADQLVFFLSGFTNIHIIPKRAFQDEQHMRTFLAEVWRLRAAAHAQSPV